MGATYLDTDRAYSKWLNENQEGFVANMTKSFTRSYYVIHRASCHLIKPGSARSNEPGAFTERGYRKVVGDTRASVLEWGLRKGFPVSSMRACQNCQQGEELVDQELGGILSAVDGEPLVLVQNERTAGGLYDGWMDVEGERYHFPNQYRNRVRPGRPFVYYRGVRQSQGRRDSPEYFGWGRIGNVYRDEGVPEDAPKREWQWFCEIEDYQSFAKPVAWKRTDGSHFEAIAQNEWGVGVRELDPLAFVEILRAAGQLQAPPPQPSMTYEIRDDLLLAPRSPKNSGKGGGGQEPSRRSRDAYRVGRDGERLVLTHLMERAEREQWTEVRWVADDGEKPGWDLQYVDARGVLQAVEVKTTTGPKFLNVELTAGEWAAALAKRDDYHLVLVADVYGKAKLQFISNPYGLVQAETARVEPLLYRFTGSTTR